MLKGINPLLSPDLLATLRAMGHGDEIAAILSLMPIDDFVPEAIFRSTVGADAERLDPIHQQMIACCARHEPERRVVPLVGQDFYGRVKAAHIVVQTGEPALYANIILRKGVIYPQT